MVHKTLACQYTQVDDVLRLIAQVDGLIVEQTFTHDVFLTIALPEQQLQNIQQKLLTMSSGQLKLKSLKA